MKQTKLYIYFKLIILAFKSRKIKDIHSAKNGFVLEVKEYRDFKIGKHFGYTDKLYKREQGA